MSSFRCLAIDTATHEPSVAACCDAAVAVSQFAGARETEQIFTHVRRVLTETGLELGSLDCIAVGSGPGSFTGLRVGVAAAQALAFGAQLPVCSISSLAVLAFGSGRRAGVQRVAALLDARMGELYAGYYEISGAGVRPLMPDQVTPPAELRLPGADSFLAAGPGWAAYPALAEELRPRIVAAEPEACPSAADLLALAREAFARGDTQSAATVLPQYLRDRVTG